MQVKKVIYAFCSEERAEKLFGICAMISRSFTRFFTGQCLEALILGGLFFADINDFPHALCIADQCRYCLYRIDTNLWCFCRMHFWRFPDFYRKPTAGCCVSDYIFRITAN